MVGGQACGVHEVASSLFASLVVHEEVGELLLEGFDLGTLADEDVRVARVVERVVLVIILGAVEAFERHYLGNDGTRKDMRGIELLNVCSGEPLLFVVRVEDGGAIRGADVGPLTVELSGIVRDGEEDAKQLAISDLRGIVDDLDRFGVAGGFCGDLIVSRAGW